MRVSINGNTYIHIALLLLILPHQWLWAWLISVIFHEFCHWAALRICGGRVFDVHVGFSGAKMQCTPLSDLKRIIAIAVGPIGGLALSAFGKWIPRIAICSFVLSIYNMIPIMPLDGGRIVQILLQGNTRAFVAIEKIVKIILFIFCIVISFTVKFNILFILVFLVIVFGKRNKPCKEGFCKVQ